MLFHDSNEVNDPIVFLQELQTSQQNAETYSAPSLITQEYAHMGRGGAGNYYSPSSLTQTGKFTDASPASISDAHGGSGIENGAAITRSTAPPPSISHLSTAPAYRGRGGAGNFLGDPYEKSANEIQQERARQQEAQEQAKKGVDVDVEARLARPGKAYLSQHTERRE